MSLIVFQGYNIRSKVIKFYLICQLFLLNFQYNMQSDPILVTYASRTGFTSGVANTVGKTLAEGGAAVEVLDIKDVKDLSKYRAIVAGSAIQGGKWLPEAMQFIKKYQAVIAGKPFATFTVCMTLAMKRAEKYRPFVSDMVKPIRALVKPVSEGFFAGGLDISRIPSAGGRFKFRLSVLIGIWKEGDHRNWNEIDVWASNLKNIL